MEKRLVDKLMLVCEDEILKTLKTTSITDKKQHTKK